MTKNPVAIGFALYGVTMLLFFIVYYFFANASYWDTSMAINAFGLTFLYGITAFLSVYFKRGGGYITYPQAFRQAFVPVFIGGFFSISSMFLFLNYVDTDARDLLIYQHSKGEQLKLDESYNKQIASINAKDKEKVDAINKEYKEFKTRIDYAMNKKENLFSFQSLSRFFGGILLFYLLLSIIIAAFLKNKKRYE
ncbi:DUF4199 domain-containing protein [Chryseobacterium sp. T1]